MCTYSTCLDHSGGSLNVMNIQLVKMVHMMIMLNNVKADQLRKVQALGHIILQELKLSSGTNLKNDCFLSFLFTLCGHAQKPQIIHT